MKNIESIEIPISDNNMKLIFNEINIKLKNTFLEYIVGGCELDF